MPEISNPNRRKLSTFVFKETVFEYLSGHLNRHQTGAFEEYMRQNPAENAEIERMQNAIAYCAKLRETTLSEEVLGQVLNHREPVDLFLALLDWRKWPDSMRWSIEAAFAAFVVLVLVVALPWGTWIKNLKSDDKLTLARGSAPVSDDAEAKQSLNTQNGYASVTPISVNKDPVPPPAELKPVEAADVKAETLSNKPTRSDLAVSNDVQLSGRNFKGELYRIDMEFADLDTLTPALVEKLTALGAQRAGQVELGTRQTKESYFHFSLPTGAMEPFLTELKSHGSYKLSREAHRRVMPEGISRVILRIKKAEGP